MFLLINIVVVLTLTVTPSVSRSSKPSDSNLEWFDEEVDYASLESKFDYLLEAVKGRKATCGQNNNSKWISLTCPVSIKT